MTKLGGDMSIVFDIDAVFDTSDYLYFYEHQLTRERTRREVEFIINVLRPAEGSRILDLACGYGRHANELARLGYDVTGIDVMPGFLDKARGESELHGYPVTFLKEDIRRIALKEKFDCGYVLFNSFGYFDDQTNQDILNRFSDAIKRGGRVCLDVLNVSNNTLGSQAVTLNERGQDIMIDRWNRDVAAKRLQNNRIIFRDGRRKDVPYSVRLYSRQEINSMLSSAGLKVIGEFGGFDRSELQENSTRIICVAEKI
jgi:SAM-dependent methyltransferase